MAVIKTLKENGRKIYPITSSECVFTPEGKTVDALITEKVRELPERIGKVEDDVADLGHEVGKVTKNIVILDGKKTFAEQVTEENTIYDVRDVFDLNGASVTIQSGCSLRFNGGIVSNGTIVGNGVFIDAPSNKIFSNIQISGYFANNMFPVEWWGASSAISGNDVFINEAISSFDTTYSYTLLLSSCYEVNDTIYTSDSVSLFGNSVFSRSKYKNDSGTLLVNFQEQNKWVIDTKKKDGDVLAYNVLYSATIEADMQSNKSQNICGLHIKYKTNAKNVYGGIRLYGHVCSKICDIDLSAGFAVGLAILGNSWNISIDNSVIYAKFCGLYIGETSTTTNTKNLWIVGRDNDSNVYPTIRDTTKPEYCDGNISSCMILEGARITCTACSYQSMDAIMIGTNYSAYLENPYIEQIAISYVWQYCTQTYTSGSKRDIVIKNSQLGVYRTSSYSLATVRGVIEVYGLSYCRCYTPSESWDYKSYFVHLNNGTSNLATLYYDDFVIAEDGSVSNCSISPYKELIYENGITDDYKRVFITDQERGKNTEAYRNALLLTGYSNQSRTTFGEVAKRGYDKVNMTPIYNATKLDIDDVLVSKDVKLTFVKDLGVSISFVDGKSFKFADSKFTIEGKNPRGNGFNANNNNDAYIEVSGDCEFNYKNLIFQVATKHIKLVGDKPVNLRINTQDMGHLGTFGANYFLFNPEFEYPYKIDIFHVNTETGVTQEWHYTNTTRPTKGITKGFEHYDTTLNKPIWWTGTKWVDATGADV